MQKEMNNKSWRNKYKLLWKKRNHWFYFTFCLSISLPSPLFADKRSLAAWREPLKSVISGHFGCLLQIACWIFALVISAWLFVIYRTAGVTTRDTAQSHTRLCWLKEIQTLTFFFFFFKFPGNHCYFCAFYF